MPRPKRSPPVAARFPDAWGVPIVCPDCRSELLRNEPRLVCLNPTCRRAYVIDDGIPRLIISESAILDEPEWRQLVPPA